MIAPVLAMRPLPEKESIVMRNLFAAAQKHGGRVFAGLVAAVVLAPVPVMALTYSNTFSYNLSYSGSPAAPSKPSYTETIKGQEDDVTVDMGTANNTSATSTLTFSRNITVGAGGESVFGEADYGVNLASAGFTSSEKVTDSKGKTVYLNLAGGQFNVNNTGANQTYAYSQDTTSKLAAGNYIFTLTVAYHTNNKVGSWSINAKSKHHFELLGL
jgi:hypothetical protein